jgi:hypothetical protein
MLNLKEKSMAPRKSLVRNSLALYIYCVKLDVKGV